MIDHEEMIKELEMISQFPSVIDDDKMEEIHRHAALSIKILVHTIKSMTSMLKCIKPAVMMSGPSQFILDATMSTVDVVIEMGDIGLNPCAHKED